MATPSKNGEIYAGAKTRYDDFLALHIIQTDYIHFNVSKIAAEPIGGGKPNNHS